MVSSSQKTIPLVIKNMVAHRFMRRKRETRPGSILLKLRFGGLFVGRPTQKPTVRLGVVGASVLLPALAIQFEKLLPVDTCAWVEGEVFGNHMGGVQVGVRGLGFPHHSLIIIGNNIGLSAYVV
jgi:hypothetical protein